MSSEGLQQCCMEFQSHCCIIEVQYLLYREIGGGSELGVVT